MIKMEVDEGNKVWRIVSSGDSGEEKSDDDDGQLQVGDDDSFDQGVIVSPTHTHTYYFHSPSKGYQILCLILVNISSVCLPCKSGVWTSWPGYYFPTLCDRSDLIWITVVPSYINCVDWHQTVL